MMNEQNMDAILVELSKPFHPSHITWKPGVFNRDKTKALALAYADLRAYQNRLDEVCGMNWSVSYTPWGDRIVCHLTINGVTRSSTGEPDSQSERSEIAGTAAEAQAFKRACAMFGLGRYLYNLPSIWTEYDNERRQFTEQGKARLNGIIVQHYRRHTGEEELQSLHANGNGATPEPTPEAEEPSKVAQPMPETPTQEPAKQEIPKKAAPKKESSKKTPARSTGAADEALHAEFNQLGAELYGDQWDQVRRHNVERISGGAVKDSEELGESEIKKLINGLKKLKRQKAA